MSSRLDLDLLSERLLTACLIGVAIFLPWRVHYANVCSVSAGSFWLMLIVANKKYLTPQTWRLIILLISPYLVEVIGMIHTDNVPYGLFRLEAKLAFVLMPVVILASGISHKTFQWIKIAFVASTTLACLWCSAVAIKTIIETDVPWTAVFSSASFSNMGLTTPINALHPMYLTLFICISIFVLVDVIRANRRYYYLLIFIILFLAFFAFQLSSRAGIVALLCTFLIIGANLFPVTQIRRVAIYFVAVLAIFSATVWSVPVVRERLIGDFERADFFVDDQFNSVSLHVKSWYCAYNKWLDGHILFGYGTGDEVITIEDCYLQHGWTSFRHDAHNEFLSSLVKHGVFGLLVLLTVLGYSAYRAWQTRSALYMNFLVIVFLGFLSESMLRGQTGLVFFTFFNALFIRFSGDELFLKK